MSNHDACTANIDFNFPAHYMYRFMFLCQRLLYTYLIYLLVACLFCLMLLASVCCGGGSPWGRGSFYWAVRT